MCFWNKAVPWWRRLGVCKSHAFQIKLKCKVFSTSTSDALQPQCKFSPPSQTSSSQLTSLKAQNGDGKLLAWAVSLCRSPPITSHHSICRQGLSSGHCRLLGLKCFLPAVHAACSQPSPSPASSWHFRNHQMTAHIRTQTFQSKRKQTNKTLTNKKPLESINPAWEDRWELVNIKPPGYEKNSLLIGKESILKMLKNKCLLHFPYGKWMITNTSNSLSNLLTQDWKNIFLTNPYYLPSGLY